MERPHSFGRASARPRLVALGVAAIAVVVLASGCVVNGTWTALTLATPTPASLGLVECVSETSCVAFGSPPQVWDGTTWSSLPASAKLPSGTESLDCFTIDRCAAIEQRFDEWLDDTYHLMLFDGSSWSEAPGLGDLGHGDPNLLSCAPGGCVVADTWDRMITWDGSTVTVAAQPDPIFALNMDCVAIDDCLAISGDTSRWDGSEWAEVAEGAPDISESGHLACAATTDRCLTVGQDIGGTNRSMVWDGAAWTEAPLPSSGPVFFSSLSCAASFECVATGAPPWGISGPPTVLAFITNWYVAPTPPGGANARYGDVSCVAQTCVGVGIGTPPGGGADAGIASRYHWTYP